MDDDGVRKDGALSLAVTCREVIGLLGPVLQDHAVGELVHFPIELLARRLRRQISNGELDLGSESAGEVPVALLMHRKCLDETVPRLPELFRGICRVDPTRKRVLDVGLGYGARNFTALRHLLAIVPPPDTPLRPTGEALAGAVVKAA